MDRVTFLDRIYASRTQLEALLAKLTPEQMTAPALPGERSVKDLLAHIGWWERRALELYHESIANQRPSYNISEEQLDALNDSILQRYRPLALDEVRAFERDIFTSLIAVVETADEADLFEPGRFAWTEGRPLSDYIEWNSFGHYDEHLVELRPLAGESALPPVARRAGEFLAREGRDIERALFDFAFHAAPVESVLDVLAGYQTPDGGFTRLEVDIGAPVANPFAAELALRILAWIDAPRAHPLVQRLVAHLEESQDEQGCWRFSPEVYDGPLAPWFQGWEWPNLNPSGQITGALKLLGLGSDRLHARVQALFERMAKPADLTSAEYYSVLPYGLYHSTEWGYPAVELYRWGLVWWLIRQETAQSSIDASHFMELVPRPDGPIAGRLPPEVLAARLDQLAADQMEDGGWPTPYSPLWRSWLTMQNLLILKAYGRLA